MKKLFTLFMLLCMGCMGVWAGVVISNTPTAVEDLSTTKLYAIYVKQCYKANTNTGDNVSNVGYLYKHSTTGSRVKANSAFQTDNPLPGAWILTRNSEGGITLRNGYQSKLINVFTLNSSTTNESGFDLGDTAGKYKAVGSAADGYTLQGYDGTNYESPNKAWLNYNTSNGLWVAYAADRAAKFQFFELSITDDTALTSQYVPDGYYYIRTYNDAMYDIVQPYVTDNGSTMRLTAKKDLSGNVGLWNITQVETTEGNYAYKIQSVQNPDKCWVSGPAAPLSTGYAKYAITYDNTRKAYRFNGHSTESSISNKKCVTPKSATEFERAREASEATDADFYELIPLIPVTYTYKCEGVDNVDVVMYQSVGTDFAAPVVPVFGEVSSLGATGTVSASNKTCVVNYTQNLPFVPGNVYYLGDRLHKTGDNAGNIQYYSYGDISDKKVPSHAGSPVCAKNYMWTIERVANTFDQFYLKNLALGYVSTADGNSQQSVLGENKTAMKLYEYTGDGHRSGNKDFGFTDIALPTNVFGDHASSHLGYWKPGQTGNEGSALRVVDVDFDVLPTAYTTPDEQHAGYVTEISVYNSAKVAAAKNQPTVDNVLSLFADKVSALDPNKYYRILDYLNRDVNASPNADTEGAAIDSNRGIKTNASTTNATSLWQFEEISEISGNYYVKHVNSGLYIGQPSSGSAVALPLEKQHAGIFAVTENNTNLYKHTLVRSGVYLNTNNQINEVHGWGADGDGSRWYIVEAETVPVTVSTVGYTTINLPVAVTIPNEVTAYKVIAENENTMTLAEVTGSVAAKTPLIIKADANTYNFRITTSYNTIDGNILDGTTARRTGFSENSFYALAAQEGDGVCFKKNGTVNAIPANKAYLPVTTTSPTQALYFDFGGDLTTGIESTGILPNADALYNLQGQPVNQPSRGIYVKANGQKVFIK